MDDSPLSPDILSPITGPPSPAEQIQVNTTNDGQASTSDQSPVIAATPSQQSPALAKLLTSPNLCTRKRKRNAEGEEEESFEEDGVLYLKVKPNTYFLRSGEEIPAIEGFLPMACFICYKVIEFNEVTSLPHMRLHPNEKMCKICAETLIKQEEPSCSMCREENLLLQCHFCKNQLPRSEVIMSFHDHLDEHACFICLSIMLRPTNSNTKLLKCPSHTAATYVDLSGIPGITDDIKKQMSFMSVIMKAYAEQLKDLTPLLPRTAENWQQLVWNTQLRSKLGN